MENSSNKIITYTEFINNELNSLTWYDLMPESDIEVTECHDSRTAVEIADTILSSEIIENQDLIDLLAAKIINNCSSINSYDHWSKLAFQISEIMSMNLTQSGSRSLRMRVQRLNYYLQGIIDSKCNEDYSNLIISELTLDGNKPWDYLKLYNGEWWISSDDKNIHHRGLDSSEKHWSIGLPTQIDLQPDGRLAFGSLYTNGAVLTDGKDWEEIQHDAPIILTFEHDGKRLFLDHQCRLWGDEPRYLMRTAPNRQVHFARYFDGIVYLLDNGDFGSVTMIVIKTGEIRRQSTLPVQVCNDLVVTRDSYYLIDKQQGSIFKFNTNWDYENRVLHFGTNTACLQDPVAIRIQDGCLFVVSWMTARLTKLKLF